MPKFFVFSDVHGFYSLLIKALNEAGFDKNNPDHWLISCGDNFDRGKENLEMLEYLLHSERVVLIKGNHEDLLMDMLSRGFPGRGDIQNCTADTVLQISGELEKYTAAHKKILPLFNRMKDYFETEKFIFVHGWIPTKSNDNFPPWFKFKNHVYNPDWRKASEEEWQGARWYNGMKMAHEKIIEKDKIIVCGHYHVTWGKARYYTNDNIFYEFGEKADFSPYYNDGIIAIDACTAYSNRINVVVIEDEFIKN